MNWALIGFWVLAAISVGSALLVVANRNPVRSALFLVVNFFVLAVFYLTLSAQFIAAVQIIVYAGAIMVLFLFVIMLLNLGAADALRERGGLQAPVAAVLALVFLGVLAAAGAVNTGVGGLNVTHDPSHFRSGGSEITDLHSLITKLQNPDDPLAQRIREQLSDAGRSLLAENSTVSNPNASGSEGGNQTAADFTTSRQLANELNRALDGPSLYAAALTSQVPLSDAEREFAQEDPQGEELTHLNRLILESAYPAEIAKKDTSGDPHINGQPHVHFPLGSVESVGEALFDIRQPWFFPFEVTSILLLVGVVGAIVLAKRRI